jgi:hypothetical protein
MLGKSHPLVENWHRFSLKTSQWESDKITIVRTGLKLLTPSDNRALKTTQVLTWNPILKIGTILTFWFRSVGPELHLPFDTSSLVGCCSQSHEILLNKGMKYWDSTLITLGSRTYITILHITAIVINWKLLLWFLLCGPHQCEISLVFIVLAITL